jgi:serine-type D-Ala-D-Ala carboxypeptidase (penicillin-binding protein 5/6)
VLFGENDHVLLPPASLTKLLTAMIAVDWLPPGTLVPVSPEAANVYPDRVGMKAGQQWPLDITVHALLIFSANDAAYALAERVGGSLNGFATIMHEAAAQLGMSDGFVLRDPAGLDGTEGVGGGNLLSAWDVAIAARDVMANPALASIVGLPTYQFTDPAGIVHDIANKNGYFLQSYPGAIGVKTGFTDPAGFCVAEEAQRAGRAMLAVVMKGESSYQTAADLLDEGFATPLSAERADPLLPARAEPEPPALVRPKTRPLPGRLRAVPGPAAAGAIEQPRSTGLSPAVVGGAAAGVVALAVAAGVLYRRRGRRRPAGSHSPKDLAPPTLR